MTAFLNAVFGCGHRWGWPHSDRACKYPVPYDATQRCSACGAERLYSFHRMQPGPLIANEPLMDQEACFTLASAR